MSTDKTDFWVGLFVLIGGLALAFLALRAGNLNAVSFAPTYAVTASFDNIGGLKARAAVKSAGVVVGRVSSIDFDDKTYRAVVTVQLDERYKFPADSSASIFTSGLLGEQYIGIDPGGDEAFIEANKSFQYTQSAVVLENLISRFLYGMADKQGDAAATQVTE